MVPDARQYYWPVDFTFDVRVSYYSPTSIRILKIKSLPRGTWTNLNLLQ